MPKKGWGWVYDPHSGGVKIPPAVQEKTRKRILDYAQKKYSGKFTKIDVRFRNQLCYFDAYTEPYVSPEFDPNILGESREDYVERLRNTPTHLGRIRYFGDENRWSLAFYTYSHEKYEPSVFNNGTFHGTPEEAFETCSVYLEG
ncbi:MAG: hypothetical protein HQK77_10620 [Desulfobacterales bacterium]|nr:hypothetical protein [Desulfobacterales bacterium]